MKTILLLALLLASPLIAAPVKKAQPDRLAATVQWYEDKLTAIDGLVGQLKVSVDSADAKAKSAQDELATTKSDLDQTYIHLADVEKKFDKIKSDLAEQKIKTAKLKLEAHKNASERDVFVVAFAILAATAACYAIFPVINKVLNVAFPWTLAWLPAWGLLVAAFYGIERAALRILINHL